jgi:prepilin-type N-terminal cleavage/methylation domain-containing protein
MLERVIRMQGNNDNLFAMRSNVHEENSGFAKPSVDMEDRRKRYVATAGFSMVELLITLALLSIVLVIATPTVRGWVDNSNLKGAARGISGDIYSLKERAIAENRQYRIVFNVYPTNTYLIQQGAAPYNTIQTRTFQEYDNVQMTIADQFDVTTRGTMSAGTIVLRNGRGSTATITTLPTGRAHVTYNMQ